MKIDDTLILRLESLAKLTLAETERESIKKDLNNILVMIDKLHEVNTDGIEPLIYVNENKSRRADQSITDTSQEEALQNAVVKDKPYFKVPKVINV